MRFGPLPVRAHHVDLLRAAAIAFEADARAVRRVGRRGVDRRAGGQLDLLLGAQIEHEQIGVAALLQAHDHALAVGRKPRREAHVGEIADHLALVGLDVEQIDPRLIVDEGHVGDFLRRRREPRRQHEIAAAGQDAHVGAVLVHDGEPLDPLLLRTGFVDEHHAAVEIAGVAGQALIDRVRDDMRDPAPDVGRGEILRAGELLGRRPRPTAGTPTSAGRRSGG